MTNEKQCQDCKPKAKEPDVKYYCQGTQFYYVENKGWLDYQEDEFQSNDNDSGYFCGTCERELTKKEVGKILGTEVD